MFWKKKYDFIVVKKIEKVTLKDVTLHNLKGDYERNEIYFKVCS